ncbi:MAG TPA: hypothetical protein VGU26_06925, partial [Gaiellaceae bacterium]|nr:hypothetical protein [Gaiellaceae bacterium]
TAALACAISLAYPVVAGAQTLLTDDTRVNTAVGDPGDNTTQSETSLVVRGNTVCAGFNDSGPGAGLSGFARSPDRGVTWTDQGELGAGNNGDPTLAVNLATGTFYYGENATISANPAIGVARSTDDCQTFGTQVNASAASSGLNAVGNVTTLSDKPSIAVDNSGGANNGNVYVCWTRFIDTSNPSNGTADTSELRFSRSTDGGATYVNEQVIQVQGPAPFGCSVKVGPNGEVYVVWADRTGATAGDIRFRSSTDGGQTFGANVQVSTGNRLPGSDRVVSCGTNNNRTTLNGNIRMLHQAWLAVDTTGSANDGNLYVVWASDPTGATDNSDVFFSRSTNGGATWSAPIQLGGGTTTDQFEPVVAVGGDEGTVSVAWYDRRNDTANNLNVDVYKAFSTDGGAAFGALQRVTNAAFGVPQLNPNFDPAIANCYMGEYIAVTADAGRFYYLWGDNRNTVTNVNWPAGRPDPDVFFESEAAPDQPITATGTTINTVEGTPFSGTVASFTDPDVTATASEYSATINWGDGTAPTNGTITGPVGGPFSVAGSHTYVQVGTYSITVVITDVDNPLTTATAISTANVADAPLTATCSNQVSSQSYAGLVASFVDGNPFSTPAEFTATIDWGDSTPSTPGTITAKAGGGFDVAGTHLYFSTGSFTVTTTINDIDGSVATASCTFLIAGVTAGGSFVVGDLDAAVGSNVTFWGAQWSKRNSLSGGAAPPSFKGFANSPASAPACGQSWSTGPGASSGPPSPPLADFILVRVASSISKDGSTISGNTPRVVVVRVDPGYDSNPGHAGTGTVAGVLC